MKRGLIGWSHDEISPATFEARIETFRALTRRDGVPAVVVYSDVWRSNEVRWLSNFMPYWNRSLLVVPSTGAPTLICGLSPRVYPWIRSVTTLDDIRPGKNIVQRLDALAAEQRWPVVGVLDLERLPHDLHAELSRARVMLSDVDAGTLFARGDTAEHKMRQRAARLARGHLDHVTSLNAPTLDSEVVARLERDLRRAGAEDLVIWCSDGFHAPRPASAVRLEPPFSVVVAVEYRGHWAQVGRVVGAESVVTAAREAFEQRIGDLRSSGEPVTVRTLSGPYPFEAIDPDRPMLEGTVVSVHAEHVHSGRRLFYGDTCVVRAGGATLL